MPAKFEREIDEILEQAGSLKAKSRTRKHWWQSIAVPFGGLVAAGGGATRVASLGKVLFLTGVGLMVAGLVLRIPWMAILGVALLVVAYVRAVVRGRGAFKEVTGSEKTWRGRRIDTLPPGKWRSKLGKWFRPR